jgi:hypothetical protein
MFIKPVKSNSLPYQQLPVGGSSPPGSSIKKSSPNGDDFFIVSVGGLPPLGGRANEEVLIIKNDLKRPNYNK